MHINKNILLAELNQFIECKYHNSDKIILLELCQKIINYNPTRNCIVKSKRSEWHGLPPDKSLFHSANNCGLPIGNLTSQVFANFYLNLFDHFIKHDLGIRYYGRYVDDFVIVDQDKAYLKSLIPVIKSTLQERLGLTLHPDKIYLQHYTKGVEFLGSVIKPHRIYIANRTKGNFHAAIMKQNVIVRESKPNKKQEAAFLSSMNSYLGIMIHRKSYKLRRKMLFTTLSNWWWNHVYLSGGLAKFVIRTKSIKSKKAYRSSSN